MNYLTYFIIICCAFGGFALLYSGFPCEVELSSGIENAYQDAKKDAPMSDDFAIMRSFGLDPGAHNFEKESSYEPERDSDGRDY